MQKYRPKRRPQAAELDPTQGVLVRAVGAVTLVGIGAMHFLQIVPTFEATPLLGVSYVALIAACVVVATRLVTVGGTRTWLAAGVVCVAALGGYVFTRLLSTPLDNQDVGNWACMLGMAAIFVEGLMVALSAYTLTPARSDPRSRVLTADVVTHHSLANRVGDRRAG